jgi:gliding motility-associated-like protein
VPTLYTVAMSNSCGTILDSVFVDVIVVEAFAWRDTLVCPGIPVPLLASGSRFYAWTPITGLSDPNIADPIAMPAESTTYQVLVSDTAGCSDTASVTVQLRPFPAVEAGPDVVTDFGQWVSLLATGTGTLEWTPPLWLDDPQSESPRSRPEESITYTVTVTDSDGCKNSDVLTIILNGELYVPNTFTPNGDGYNDLFGALGKDIATFRMLVFNRWGEQIWSTDQLAGRWDGNCNGVASPIDTYVWKLEAAEISGRQRSAIGHVNLVR